MLLPQFGDYRTTCSSGSNFEVYNFDAAEDTRGLEKNDTQQLKNNSNNYILN